LLNIVLGLFGSEITLQSNHCYLATFLVGGALLIAYRLLHSCVDLTFEPLHFEYSHPHPSSQDPPQGDLGKRPGGGRRRKGDRRTYSERKA
jgi:hypothetical protein